MVCSKKEGVLPSGSVIKKALILKFKLSGFEDFKISSGWLKKFKICDGIRQLNVEGKKMSGNIAAVD